MKTEVGNDMTIITREDGKLITRHHARCTIVFPQGTEACIQVHEIDEMWEVWYVPALPDRPCCIASSTNPPDRHYDE